jgi:DHA1 family bicyclomycin/chloramphenicol resistance-like MFS transporter
MQPGVVVLLLTLLLGIQPITTDLYLPALPTLQRDLGAGMGATQLTLSALIISFGLAQLVAGPLSDRFGRRPLLIGGLGLYTVASVGGALAGDIDSLIAWRTVQGVGMAGAVTCARSILRDLFEPQEGARVMSRALGGLGVIAMLSPLLGGLIVQWLDWHWALLVLALFGAGSLAFVGLRYRESVPALNRQATDPATLWRNWLQVLRHPTFRAWTALQALAYGGLFVILAASSFVYIEVLGLSKLGYGLLMAANSLCYIAGTALCRRWLAQVGLRSAVRRGAWFSLLGGLGMAAVSIAGMHTVWALFLPQCLFALGHGIHQPCGQAGAVGPFPEKAGTAASLSGCAMMVVAFGVGLWLGQRLDGTVYPLGFGVAAFGVGLALVGWTWVQRDGEPAAPHRAAAGLGGPG